MRRFIYARLCWLDVGEQDGTILVWQFNTATNEFVPAASMSGHTGPVVTLMLIGSRLYSGSMDKTIRVSGWWHVGLHVWNC